MTYRISFTPAAQKQILRLDKVAALRIRAYVEGLDPQNPRLVGAPLSGGERLMALQGGGLPHPGEHSR
jgi:mRNA-degrading endonuclease RelE of RelBE toxin-antitoxin system